MFLFEVMLPILSWGACSRRTDWAIPDRVASPAHCIERFENFCNAELSGVELVWSYADADPLVDRKARVVAKISAADNGSPVDVNITAVIKFDESKTSILVPLRDVARLVFLGVPNFVVMVFAVACTWMAFW